MVFLLVGFYALAVWLWTGWRKFFSVPVVAACIVLPGMPIWLRITALFLSFFAWPVFSAWLEGRPIR